MLHFNGGLMIIPREMKSELLRLSKMYPVLSVTGPRQSGKTTLARETFPDYAYVSLEDPDTLGAFEDDPRTFLRAYGSHVIFDEAQRAPELFQYLQQVVDASEETGRFVLTGSQNFLLMDAINQSLAGRVALLYLLPLSLQELEDAGLGPKNAEDWLFLVGYPRLHSVSIPPETFFSNYVQAYVERDVRRELGVRKVREFTTFLQLCALRTGQQLNISSLASDCGVATNTVREWLSVLEASGIVYLLEPLFRNRSKSLTKTPKFYFLDTGLAAYLMGIRSADELLLSEFRGALFETAVVAEVLKAGYALGSKPELSYWRDAKKREIDLVVRRGLKPAKAIEIKSSATYKSRFFDMLRQVAPSELGLDEKDCYVVYAGDEELHPAGGSLVSYRKLHELVQEWFRI